MPNFQDIFETRKQSLISVFSICVTAPLTISQPKIRSLRLPLLKFDASLNFSIRVNFECFMNSRWNCFWIIDIFPVIVWSQIKGSLGFSNALDFA